MGDGDGVTRDPDGLVSTQRESEVLVWRCVTQLGLGTRKVIEASEQHTLACCD